MKQYEKGGAMIEYIVATVAILIFIFGLKFDDKSVWQLFHEAFQQRHDNYSQSISNLDNVNLAPKASNETNK
mgnify:CR=1 FL=1